MGDRTKVGDKPRILHLEDDPADRELIRETLAAEGIDLEVVQVDTKADFESALADERVAVVLSDFALPHFDGLSALELVQARLQHLPFIFISGTMGEESAIESLRRGATDYVLKQRLSRLGPAVRRALEDVVVRREQMEAAEAAADRQRFLNAMLESLDAGILAYAASGELTMFNRAALEILGLTEMPGPSTEWAAHYSRFHPDGKRLFDREELPEYRALLGERVRNVEMLIRRRDKRERMVLASGQPIVGAHGRSLGAVIALHDVTERKLLEDQLRQSQKLEAVGSLAGGVAHDFNNLLTVMGGYSQLVMQQLAPSDPKFGNVQEIYKAVERAAALTRQLLAFSRQQALEPRILDLNRIVLDMEKMLRRLLPANIEFVTSLSKGIAPIKADLGQIEQVLLNLVVNARDAMPQGGRLTVETNNADANKTLGGAEPGTAHGPWVALSVRDTGTGMSAETQARIFEPFFTTKDVGKGTGLGLSTVYGIVRQSGGTVDVESEVGAGSAFRVSFPGVESTVEADHRQAGAEVQAKGTETILVVEDDAKVRSLVQGILEAAGYTVLQAGDGQEALEVIRERGERIHLVLTDIVMPKMSGLELLSRIRDEFPGCRGLCMSGHADRFLTPGGHPRDEGQDLQKPFSPTLLRKRVREVLDASPSTSPAARTAPGS